MAVPPYDTHRAIDAAAFAPMQPQQTQRAARRTRAVFRRGRTPRRKIPTAAPTADLTWTSEVFFGYFLCAKESDSRESAKGIPGFRRGHMEDRRRERHDSARHREHITVRCFVSTAHHASNRRLRCARDDNGNPEGGSRPALRRAWS